MTWREVTARVRAECEAGGLDLVHPFPRDDRLAILIGNTRALWPMFLAQADRSAKNPLDEHVVRTVSRALAPFPHQLRYAHVRGPDGFLPIQRIAEEAGLARRSRIHLSIHPEHGPWIALRAVAILDEVEAPPPVALGPDRCEGCEVRCQAALDAALGSNDWRRWLALRDACSVGREWRYSEDQIAYHYLKTFVPQRS